MIAGPECGNGWTEAGEECDCGEDDECDNQCCHPHSCTMVTGAVCAAGPCCDLGSCSLFSRSVMCRPARGECDLAEHCDGVSHQCPGDVFKSSGAECDAGAGHCHSGHCGSHHQQCKLLWGPDAGVASEKCFNFNTRGDHLVRRSRLAHPSSTYFCRVTVVSRTSTGLTMCSVQSLM